MRNPPEPTVGVVNRVASLRLGELDEQANDLARRIELATFLTGAIGEVLDEVFVGGAEQVGELEVVVDEDESGLAEVVEQVFPLLVRDLGLALYRVEVDVVLQHIRRAHRSRLQWPQLPC